MLLHRVISSTFLIGAVLAAALWMPGPGLVVLLVAIGVLCAHEMVKFLELQSIPHVGMTCLAGTAVYLGGIGWALLCGSRADATELALLLVVALFVVVCLQVLVRADGSALQAIPASMLVLLYVPVLFGFLQFSLFGLGEGDGRYFVLYMVLVVKMTDMGAYFIGSAIGKHKAFPRISPAKSWEGCIGGVLVAMGCSIGVCLLTGGDFQVVTLPIHHAVILGGVLAVTGIVGDLLESMFKRAAGVKDSGTFIRGMGGGLDVMDSLILASPVLYLYARCFL